MLWKHTRQQEAQDLLKNTSFSIEKVAELIGYHDTGNFIRAFKVHHDATPTHWRNKHT